MVQSEATQGGAECSSSSKLRDSCYACARSKVRCPKQKPSCSRCESRGITCQYFVTRRPGRKPETSTKSRSNRSVSIGSTSNSNSNNETDIESGRANERNTTRVVQPSPSACFPSKGSTSSSLATSESNSYFTVPLALSISTPHNGPESESVSDSTDVFSVLVLGDSINSPWQADFGSEISDMDFLMPTIDTTFDLSSLQSGSFDQEMSDSASLLESSGALKRSRWSSVANTGTTSSGKSSISSYSQILPSETPSAPSAAHSPSCGCLATALDLLKLLSLARLANADSQGSAPILLAENKQSIESINNMMACPSCGGDSFLLTILSMIVLKILTRYAVAARTQRQGTKPQGAEAIVGIKPADSIISKEGQRRQPSHNYAVPDDNKTHEGSAAQLVLGELHRVQRLANQLSSKFKRSTEGDGGKPGAVLQILGGHDNGIDDSGNSMVASFSASTLGLVESDVRQSLRSLSGNIIKGLRQK
ncbi:hypothetical protein BJ170DRAFT_412577 [Xylariales sp. AK1849]|nr:hypothetical protein BJ170DRAFT_412577 [Xylariales sp. AK1849]